jgi:short-subunit dehydrogenase
MKRLKNENFNYVLITGSTGGLGSEFSKILVEYSKNLIITSTNLDKAQKLATQLKKINKKCNIISLQCDFLISNDIENLIKFIIENKISLDLLVNNAGYITEGSIENSNIETLLNCVKVNCLGTIQLTKKLLETKENSKLLRIITITSMAGNYPMPYMAIYSSTKAMLTNFMLALGHEYKNKNVKCLVVQPGAIPTSDDMKNAIEAQGLKGKLSAVPPDKIAHKSLKKSLKGKKIFVPGFFNKLTITLSKIIPQSIQMKAISSMWKKSQEKRNIK